MSDKKIEKLEKRLKDIEGCREMFLESYREELDPHNKKIFEDAVNEQDGKISRIKKRIGKIKKG